MIEIGSDLLIGTGAGVRTSGTGVSDSEGDNEFAALISAMMTEQMGSQSVGTATDSGLSSLTATGTGFDASAALQTALLNGDGDTDSQLGMMLAYMLMNADSESGLVLISSLLSAQSSNITGGGQVPENAWIPTDPGITGNEGCRSSALLNSVIRQFDVESSARYTPYKNGSDTYCNIFVWDVTSALSAEIPHYVDPATGCPRRYPDTGGAAELDANATCDWLAGYGSQYGWTEVGAEEAQAYANRGCPAVAVRKNTGGAGHVQVVCPSENGAYDELRGVTIAQAGGRNEEYAYISSVCSSQSLSQVRYYVHA